MKKLFSAFLILGSFSVFANDLEWQVYDKDCRVEVLEDIYILHSTIEVQTGNVRMTANSINRNDNRRVAAGRFFYIRGLSEDKILFRDPTMKNICVFASNNGRCLSIRNLDVEDIEIYSNGMLKMVCEEKGTVDA